MTSKFTVHRGVVHSGLASATLLVVETEGDKFRSVRKIILWPHPGYARNLWRTLDNAVMKGTRHETYGLSVYWTEPRYGLDVPRIESRSWREFPHTFRRVLITTEPHVLWVMFLVPGGTAAGPWC
jgi:hypothetical protein